jgi:hypothetical protein
MQDLREAIAHAATPWEWRSRTSVVVLVLAMTALTVAMVLDGWLNDGVNPAVATVLGTTFGWLLFVRPAMRSLRRWDERHRQAKRSVPTERA